MRHKPNSYKSLTQLRNTVAGVGDNGVVKWVQDVKYCGRPVKVSDADPISGDPQYYSSLGAALLALVEKLASDCQGYVLELLCNHCNCQYHCSYECHCCLCVEL